MAPFRPPFRRLRSARTFAPVLLVIVLAAGFALSSPAASLAQESATRSLDLRDYYRMEDVSDPAISPDGRRVAFVRTYIVERENRRHREIWMAPTDGDGEARRITNPAFSSSDPSWSPDGSLLAFWSNRPLPGKAPADTSSIWFLDMTEPGGEAFNITGVTGTPIFSPDSRWIAFTKPTPPSAAAPAADVSDFERRVEERFTGRIYDWMNYRFNARGYLPDPRDPAATPPEELYVVPRSGGMPRQLTALGVNMRSAVWRPDSSALAVVADTDQRDEYNYGRSDLWLVSTDGGIRRLTDDGYNNTAPAWAPDGRSLVFRRQQGLNLVIEAGQNHGAPVDLFRLPADGGAMETLTADWDLQPGRPQWSTDGAHVYFSAGVGGNSHLFRVPVGGGAIEQVTTGDRRLRGFSVSATFDRMAYTMTDSARPSELMSSRVDGTDERLLANFNDDMLSELHVATAERIRYPSKDGTGIEGWVLLPSGYDSSRGPYPTILAIHGGPHGAYGNSFSFQFQLWAASGYVVVYTNPRGSSGYGEDFLWATWGGWGILDYEDVMAGVDYALEQYALDARRMGVTGYSYGGFMTNWVIGQTNRFTAAITGAGISNWISDYGTADIPRTKESEFFGAPWEPDSRELLMQLSPIAHVGSATTPTLFVHGEADHRVPIEEGEQMYTALRKLRVPAKFIRYPNMAHGGWTPWNTVHRYQHELNWWAEYLSPVPAPTQ